MVLCAAFGPAQGQPLQTNDAVEAVSYLGRLLGRYPDRDAAKEMTEMLDDNLKNGRYDDLDSREGLAKALTRDLRAVKHDFHLGVQYSSELSTEDAAHHLDKPEVIRRLRAENFGFGDARVLEGNVGYLRISALHDISVAADTANHALGFLRYVNALIVDIRNNLGGEPMMVRHLLSAFFAERTHLNTLHYTDGRDDAVEEIWTDPSLHADVSFADIPVYILTNYYVASGAEDLAFSAQALGRATIIGETTLGAAHLGTSYYREDLQLNFNMPHGYVVNPVTKGDWEGVGVSPDHEVSGEDAMEAAVRIVWQEIGYAHESD